MGLHTWFYKNNKLYKENEKLYNDLDKHEKDEIYLDEFEVRQIQLRIDEIDEKNDVEFHDCFRTNKREQDNSYTTDIIYSENECNKWLIDNSDLIYYMNKDSLNEFWNKYPDGVIDFG